jgi:hypothetical protein
MYIGELQKTTWGDTQRPWGFVNGKRNVEVLTRNTHTPTDRFPGT